MGPNAKCVHFIFGGNNVFMSIPVIRWFCVISMNTTTTTTKYNHSTNKITKPLNLNNRKLSQSSHHMTVSGKGLIRNKSITKLYFADVFILLLLLNGLSCWLSHIFCLVHKSWRRMTKIIDSKKNNNFSENICHSVNRKIAKIDESKHASCSSFINIKW